jgi:anti-anti-sigma factor
VNRPRRSDRAWTIEPGKPPASPEPAADAARQAAPSKPAPTPSAGRFTDEMQAGVHVISFSRSDVLDAEYIRQVGDDIYRHLRKHQKPKVVMDLQSVQFMSSSALGMLIALRGAVVGKMSGTICIANVSDDLKEVFRITKLHKMMKLHGNTDKAIKSLL